MESYNKEDWKWEENFFQYKVKYFRVLTMKKNKSVGSECNIINHLTEWRVKGDSGELWRPSLMEWILKPVN